MRICYIDESGDGRRPNPNFPYVPTALVIGGLVLESTVIPHLTRDFMNQLVEGETREGTVSSVVPFGAFVCHRVQVILQDMSGGFK